VSINSLVSILNGGPILRKGVSISDVNGTTLDSTSGQEHGVRVEPTRIRTKRSNFGGIGKQDDSNGTSILAIVNFIASEDLSVSSNTDFTLHGQIQLLQFS